ncbi:AbfB domain-containing protein [Actinokineospora soli]|uniref:AbfB domain-containing protein n=1 Tax=Actinokineospora soli TaxID=1048753 RepID=A0ABW2TLI0_9PSEU
MRLKAYNVANGFVRHWEYRARVDTEVRPLADSQFRVVPGLAGSGSVSLESTNFPGYYLRHRGFELWVERDDGSALFRGDASFTRRAGLASASAVSFESLNFPGRYLRHRDSRLYLEPVADAVGRADATYVLE